MSKANDIETTESANDGPCTVAIIGAGPIGVEAAAAAALAGHHVLLFERDVVAGGVRQWGHVQLFSPWRLNMSEIGAAALAKAGVAVDPDAFPTGDEYVDTYLVPLLESVSDRVELHLQTEVISVVHPELLKSESIGGEARRASAFELLVEKDGVEMRFAADQVLDVSGVTGHANALGPGGAPALGERKLEHRILRRIPDVAGKDHDTFADKVTLVVGAGYSAITTVHLLLQLKDAHPDTTIIWATRSDSKAPYDLIDDDPLPQRNALAKLGNALSAGDAKVRAINGVWVDRIAAHHSGGLEVELRGDDGSLLVVDNVVANVGFQPETSITRELQVHHCYASEGPMKLAASLLAASGDGADCLAQEAPSADILATPEPNFFVLGSKSYGRRSDFLLRVGIEQVGRVL